MKKLRWKSAVLWCLPGQPLNDTITRPELDKVWVRAIHRNVLREHQCLQHHAWLPFFGSEAYFIHVIGAQGVPTS
jgi:hypothetical protein